MCSSKILYKWQITIGKNAWHPVIRQLKIKTTVRFHLPTKIQNTGNTKHWWWCGAKEIHPLILRMQNGRASLEESVAVSSKPKRKHRLLTWSSNHSPSYLPQWVENMSTQKTHTQMFIAALLINCQNLKADKMFFSRWMDKLWYIHTTEYYSALKRNEVSSHDKTWKKLKRILLVKQAILKRQHTIWFQLYHT